MDIIAEQHKEILGKLRDARPLFFNIPDDVIVLAALMMMLEAADPTYKFPTAKNEVAQRYVGHRVGLVPNSKFADIVTPAEEVEIAKAFVSEADLLDAAEIIWNTFSRMGGDFRTAKGTVAYDTCVGAAGKILAQRNTMDVGSSA